MRFGTRAADAPDRSAESFIKYAKKGETKVRFLQEVDDWIEYFEHYNPTPGGFAFPCTGDRKNCPGCTSTMEKMQGTSRRYLVNVLMKGYVEPFKITAKLKDRLVTRSERNGGTITDRDYTLINHGDGEYDYDQEIRSRVDLDMYKSQLHDLEKMLFDAFKQEWPDYELADYEPPSKVEATPLKQEPPPFKQPVEANEQVQSNGSVDQEITVEQLQAMRYGQIVSLLEKQGVNDYPEDASKPELIEWIEKKFS